MTALFVVLPLAASAAGAPDITGVALVEALKAGGHAIYVRHGHADQGIDKDAVRLGPCSEQRGLSAFGRADAAQVGQAFKKLGIPVGQVYASPYCRAIETANIAFGPAEVDHDLRLWHGELTDAQRASLPGVVRDKLARAPRPGTNAVYVAHNSKDVLGVDLAQGEAAVLRLDGGGKPGSPLEARFTVIARVMPGGWDAHLVEPPEFVVAAYPLPPGSRPTALTEGADGAVWYVSPERAELGRLDSFLGITRTIALSAGSAPVAVAVATDGAVWVADRGRNELMRVDPGTLKVEIQERKAARKDAALAGISGGGRAGSVNTTWQVRDGMLVHRAPNGGEKRVGISQGKVTALAAARNGVWLAQPDRDRLLLVRSR
jgi:phosphohistidine phosphatase SixA